MGGLLCGIVGLVAFALAAAGLLRFAVVLANRAVGAPADAPPPPPIGGIPAWDWDDWDEDEDDAPPPRRRRGGQAIPLPGILKGVGVVLVTAFATGLGAVLLIFALESQGLRMRQTDTRLAVAVLDLPVAFLTLSVVLLAALPTTFRRAALVAFVFGLLLAGVALTVGSVAFFFRFVR